MVMCRSKPAPLPRDMVDHTQPSKLCKRSDTRKYGKAVLVLLIFAPLSVCCAKDARSLAERYKV